MVWLDGKLNAAGIEFLEFKPSEIAAAVAMCVSGEMQAMDIDKAFSCLIGVDKVGVGVGVGPPFNNSLAILQFMFLSNFCFLFFFNETRCFVSRLIEFCVIGVGEGGEVS